MLNDWSHKVRPIFKRYCPGNIKKILPSLSQSGNIRFYFDHKKLCMDNNIVYLYRNNIHLAEYLHNLTLIQSIRHSLRNLTILLLRHHACAYCLCICNSRWRQTQFRFPVELLHWKSSESVDIQLLI